MSGKAVLQRKRIFHVRRLYDIRFDKGVQKKYNPLLLKIASWVESSDRSKAIAMIKEKGMAEFTAFMDGKKWVVFKTKDTIINKRFGKKINEK
jgi:hypothetical protein